MILSIPYLRQLSDDGRGNPRTGVYLERLLLAMKDTESAGDRIRNRGDGFATPAESIAMDELERHQMALVAEYERFAKPFRK